MDQDYREAERLVALQDLDVLDSEPEPIFESLTELAVRTFGVPVAIISLIDKDRQWFKSCFGLPVRETARDVAFSSLASGSGEVLVVPDALADPRFAHNPLVTGPPGVRFYAGAPMITPDGHMIGTLCLVDFAPRARFDQAEREHLRHLADAVMQALVMRRQARLSAEMAAEARKKTDLLELSERLAKVGTWTWDPVADKTTWSPEVFRIHGLDPAAGSPDVASLLAMYRPDDAARLAGLVERALAHGEPYELQAQIIRPDGQVRDLIMSAACRLNDQGRPALLYGSTQDVTDLKLADAHLRESEARYRLLADNANDLIAQYDPQGVLVYASPSYRRYGYEPEAMVGRPLGFMVPPEYKDRALQRFRDALAGETDERECWPARTADGRPIWLEGRLTPFYDESGAVKGVLAAIRDVSERVAAETALQEVNADLARVARVSALGVFTASLAHEINQPLAALAANCETAALWLSQDPPDPVMAAAAVKRSENDARRASEIIGRLRAMVTKARPKFAAFDLNDAVNDVIALTQVEQQRLKVTVKPELSKRVPPMLGDRIQIQQVIMNLLLNAIEAMVDAPAATRKIKVRTAAAGGGGILIEVADRGPGFDPAAADQIFDRLFTTKAGGTGLGLAISKSIVEAHGGRIWAETVAPHGAVFRVEIPAASAADSTGA